MGRAPATREPGIKKRVVIINTPPDVGLDVNDTYTFIPFRSGSQPFGANKSNCCSWCTESFPSSRITTRRVEAELAGQRAD
jgi:hypothetical protein